MTAKQRVTFRFSGSESGAEPRLPNYAIEVHDETSRLAGRGTMASGIELEAGRKYFVSAILSDGSCVNTQATIEANTTEVELPEPAEPIRSWKTGPTGAVGPGAIAGSLSVPAERAVADSRDAPTSRLAAAPRAAPRKSGSAAWRVTGFRGNLLAREPASFAPTPTAPSAPASTGTPTPSLDSWSVEYHPDGPTFIQLAQPERPVWNYAVPLSPGDRCALQLVRVGGELAIDVTLPNSNADLLLRYVANNLLQEASQTAESFNILAQDLLSEKFEYPIGASVGAYALLRLGDLDRLHDWTTNLYRLFPFLPDGVVILTEHLARVGEHQKALSTLLQLPTRGLPFFSSGLTYALNRLRQYKRAVESGKLAGDRKAIDALGVSLGRYAGYIDVTRPILTFMGADPRKPTQRPASKRTVSSR